MSSAYPKICMQHNLTNRSCLTFKIIFPNWATLFSHFFFERVKVLLISITYSNTAYIHIFAMTETYQTKNGPFASDKFLRVSYSMNSLKKGLVSNRGAFRESTKPVLCSN